jgi:hypothetical protein
MINQRIQEASDSSIDNFPIPGLGQCGSVMGHMPSIHKPWLINLKVLESSNEYCLTFFSLGLQKWGFL